MSAARVLIIDDDNTALWLARQFLDDAGFEAKGASCLSEFECVISDWTPDIVVADVKMPEVTGPQLCRVLKDRFETAHIPVVLYSALPEDELAGLAEQCEAENYVNKLAGLENLVHRLEDLCRRTIW